MNPYAAPNPHGSYGAPPNQVGYAQATLRGDVLIVERNAHLNGVCMKCGARDGLMARKAKFSWTPMWARLSVIFCTILGAIAIMVTTKRAELSVPLCASCNAGWSKATSATIGGVVLLVAGIFSFRLFDEPAIGGVVFFVALAAFIGILVGFARPKMLHAEKIDDQFVELKGVAPSAASFLSGAG
jgi:hypothetical protein